MSGNKALQDVIDDLNEFDTLTLEFGEYAGPVIIDKPIIIDGNDSTVFSYAGPVLSIKCSRVRVRNLRLEVTGDLKEQVGDSGLALRVDDNVRLLFEGVTVKGNVSGLTNEDGNWNYPDVLNIRPIVPNRKNYFAFDMEVPVSCALETEINGIRIENPGLQPGVNTIRIETDKLKDDTILFGEIEIRSTYLRRIIAISGGTFGVSAETPASKKTTPVRLDEIENTNLNRRQRKRIEVKGYRWSLVAFFFFALIVSFITILVFLKGADQNRSETEIVIEQKNWEGTDVTESSPSDDQHPVDFSNPEGEISGIIGPYTEGDRVEYTITATDNQNLKRVQFKVHNTSVEEVWKPNRRIFTYSSGFSTETLTPGTFRYSLTVLDGNGNQANYSDRFELVKKVPKDLIKPRVQVIGIRKEYTIGEQVEFRIVAEDDRDLKSIAFQVNNTSVRKQWSATGKSQRIHHSFDTQSFGSGSYSYSIVVRDRAGNLERHVESFSVEQQKYGLLNINTIPWTTIYIDGKSFGMTPIANLKLPAGKVIIRFVNEDRKIDRTETIQVAPDRVTAKSYQWQ